MRTLVLIQNQLREEDTKKIISLINTKQELHIVKNDFDGCIYFYGAFAYITALNLLRKKEFEIGSKLFELEKLESSFCYNVKNLFKIIVNKIRGAYDCIFKTK